MKSGIYALENTRNGKIYIGSAVDLIRRKRCHFHLLRNGKHFNIHLQRAWNKDGEKAFRFIVLEECPLDKLIENEQKYINSLMPEYNISPTAGSPLGVRYSPEIKTKISERLKGNKHSLGFKHTEETKRKVSMAGKGRKHTEETKAKMSIAQIGNKKALGIKHSLETRAKMSKWQIGRKLSEETKLKISENNKGKKPWNTGQHRSIETKAKLRAVNLGRTHTEDSKRKISEAAKGNSYGRGLKGIPKTEIHKQHLRDAWIAKKNKSQLSLFDLIWDCT